MFCSLGCLAFLQFGLMLPAGGLSSSFFRRLLGAACVSRVHAAIAADVFADPHLLQPLLHGVYRVGYVVADTLHVEFVASCRKDAASFFPMHACAGMLRAHSDRVLHPLSLTSCGVQRTACVPLQVACCLCCMHFIVW
jgi:hypothetical protein